MGVQKIGNRDAELQTEMKVIIDVLNRLFDEENPNYYIGNGRISIYPGDENSLTLTNRVLKNINKTSIVPRSNKNTMMYPANQGRLTLFNGENIEKYKMSRKNKTRRVKRIRNKNRNTRILRNYLEINLNNTNTNTIFKR
jgi:hypothetical protein